MLENYKFKVTAGFMFLLLWLVLTLTQTAIALLLYNNRLLQLENHDLIIMNQSLIKDYMKSD